MNALLSFLRVLLSATLLVAGATKLIYLKAFLGTLSSIGVPQASRRYMAVGIAITEIALGTGLWIPAVQRWAALLAALLLGGFSLLGLLFDSKRIRCNCFGPLFDDRLGKETAFRNLPLVVGSLWLETNASSAGTFSAADGAIFVLAAVGLILIEPLLRQPGH